MLQTETEPSSGVSPGWIFTGLFGLGLSLVLLLCVLPRPLALKLLDERGPMEMVSLVVYLLAILGLVSMLLHNAALASWGIAALLFLSVSEYNPGNLMTKWNDRQPGNPGDPVGLNVPGLMAISLVVVTIAAGLLFSSRGRFFSGLRHRGPEAWLVFVGWFFLMLSFIIDRIQGYFFNWHAGYRLEKGIFYASDVVEETLEFLMPFFFFFAILLWSRRRKHSEIGS